MDRLAFVGDSALNLAVILNMIFSGKNEYSEKELSIRRVEAIKEANLKNLGNKFKLFEISCSFEESESNISEMTNYIEKKRDHYDPAEHLQRLAGFFSLYIGIDAAYLFLQEVNVIKRLNS
jgi:hypothetical protein